MIDRRDDGADFADLIVEHMLFYDGIALLDDLLHAAADQLEDVVALPFEDKAARPIVRRTHNQLALGIEYLHLAVRNYAGHAQRPLKFPQGDFSGLVLYIIGRDHLRAELQFLDALVGKGFRPHRRIDRSRHHAGDYHSQQR